MEIAAIIEYEELLIGNQERLSSSFIGYTTRKQDQLKDLLKFTFENILRWTPEQVRNKTSIELLQSLKAAKIFSYLDYPNELDKTTDTFYLAKILYPKEIRYSHRDIVLRTYEAVLSKRRNKFPQDFFSDKNGTLNFSICLNYYLATRYEGMLRFVNIEEAYDYFANEKEANSLLTKAKLYNACYDLYESSLDMFHDILITEQKDDFLYMERKFNNEYKKTKNLILETKQQSKKDIKSNQ